MQCIDFDIKLDFLFFYRQKSTNNLGDDIFETFMVDPGIGTSCMKNMDLGYA